MSQIADVTNIKCNILEKTSKEVDARMYDVQCLIDTDELCYSRVYNWLYNSGCDIGIKKRCEIERFSNRLDISLDICDTKQVISCDEVINCSNINITEVDSENCELPKQTTITVIK